MARLANFLSQPWKLRRTIEGCHHIVARINDGYTKSGNWG